MKRIKLVLLAGLFSIAGVSQAQEQTDKKAKAILDELSAKTKSYSTIKAEFTYSVNDKQGKATETQGGTVYLKGDKFKLELKGQDIYSDGKTTWTHLKDAKEVQINDADNNAKGVTPTNIFTMYENGFKYKFEKEEGNTQIINLYPSSPDKEKYHTIKLTIDKAKKQITGMKVMMKDGTSQTYSIKSFTPNLELNDSIFIFDKKKHPVDEIDLRES